MTSVITGMVGDDICLKKLDQKGERGAEGTCSKMWIWRRVLSVSYLGKQINHLVCQQLQLQSEDLFKEIKTSVER